MTGLRSCGPFISETQQYTGKTNDFSTFAGTWMALEGIMLSEISPAEKENYHKVSLIYGT